VLCLVFALLGAVPVFFALYTAIVAATAAFTLAASVKWYREVRGFSARPAR
jgi:hypothetical protein